MQGQFSKPFDFLFSNPDYGPGFTSDQKLPDITTGKERVRDCRIDDRMQDQKEEEK